MDSIEAMRTRRSVRAYQDKAVPRELLETVVDCGRMAATALNVQPWDFVVVTEPSMRRRIAETTDHGKFIADAAACIVVLSKDTKYYLEDGSAATQNILVAARACGLGSCWIAGDKKPYADAIRAMTGAPEGHRLVSLIAVGYPAQDPSPTKRPLDETLHWERYGGHRDMETVTT